MLIDPKTITEPLPEGLSLEMTEDGLSLLGDGLSLTADLSEMIPRIKKGVLGKELLVKAARIRGKEHPTVLDATAGFGQDSLLLSAAGFQVFLYEYDPVISALLADALFRAKDVPELSEAVSRMTLYKEDSISAMKALSEAPDVIYLDPMFPKRNKSALIKKKFQLLQKLEKPCPDEEELLSAALLAHPHKIVIKRPLKGPFLAGRKPDYSLEGKAIRYDCIVLA